MTAKPTRFNCLAYLNYVIKTKKATLVVIVKETQTQLRKCSVENLSRILQSKNSFCIAAAYCILRARIYYADHQYLNCKISEKMPRK